MILLVLLCQTLVYREVTALFSLTAPESPEPSDEEAKKGKDPWSTTLNWYFFAVTNYFLYGESIIYYFKVGTHICVILLRCPYFPAARCFHRCTSTSFRRKPSYHQLHTLHHRIRWIRNVAAKRLSKAAIRSLLLGAHVIIDNSSLQVSFVH